MPFSWAARITVQLAGTVSSLSSILILTSLGALIANPSALLLFQRSDVHGAWPRARSRQALGRRRELIAVGTLLLHEGLVLDLGQEVALEMLQVALHGHGRRVGEHANGPAAHVLANVGQKFHVA